MIGESVNIGLASGKEVWARHAEEVLAVENDEGCAEGKA